MTIKFKFSGYTSLVSKSGFWMATRQNQQRNVELMPRYAGHTRQDVIDQLQDGFGEPFEKLEKEGYGVIHFVEDTG